MRLFGWSGKFYFPEIEIRWPKKKKPLTTEMLLHFYFTFKGFSENERERERERESARKEKIQFGITSSSSNPRSRSTARSRRRSRSREEGEIAVRRDRDLGSLCAVIAISDRDRTVIGISDRDRDCAVSAVIAISDRDHGAVVGLETFLELMIFFFWVVACVFWFVFSFFFSKHQKIFSGKFFEIQPNTWKHFPFPEISISGKYVFSGKRFTATKHSLHHQIWWRFFFFFND